MNTLLHFIKKTAVTVGFPFYLLACYMASKQDEETPDCRYDSGEYTIVAQGIDRNYRLGGNSIPFCGLNIDDNPLGGYRLTRIPKTEMWEFLLATTEDINSLRKNEWLVNRSELERFVTTSELRSMLANGATIKTNGHGATVIVVKRGNHRKWRLHQLQEGWREHLQARAARREKRDTRKLARA